MRRRDAGRQRRRQLAMVGQVREVREPGLRCADIFRHRDRLGDTEMRRMRQRTQPIQHHRVCAPGQLANPLPTQPPEDPVSYPPPPQNRILAVIERN